MPRPNNPVPTYRHNKRTGQAVVTIDGRDIYLGKFNRAASKAEYARVIAERVATGSATPPTKVCDQSNAGITVTQLIRLYWRHAQRYYVKNGKPTKELDSIKVALRPLRRLYGKLPARQFGPKSLKAVRQTMIDRGLYRSVSWLREIVQNRTTKFVDWKVSPGCDIAWLASSLLIYS